jgi:hypothetical protein
MQIKKALRDAFSTPPARLLLLQQNPSAAAILNANDADLFLRSFSIGARNDEAHLELRWLVMFSDTLILERLQYRATGTTNGSTIAVRFLFILFKHYTCLHTYIRILTTPNNEFPIIHPDQLARFSALL